MRQQLRFNCSGDGEFVTQGLSDELSNREGDAAGRLLVLAESRQNAAQRALIRHGIGDLQIKSFPADRSFISDACHKHGRASRARPGAADRGWPPASPVTAARRGTRTGRAAAVARRGQEG